MSKVNLGRVVGNDGKGISKIEKTATNGLVDTYTITYTDGTTSTYTVTNGKDGASGSGLDISGVELTGSRTETIITDVATLGDFVDITSTDNSNNNLIASMSKQTMVSGNTSSGTTSSDVTRASISKAFAEVPTGITITAKDGYNIGIYVNNSLQGQGWILTYTTTGTVTNLNVVVKRTDNTEIDLTRGSSYEVVIDTYKITYEDETTKNFEVTSPIVNTDDTPTSKWKGKIGAFMGDSITYGTGTSTGSRYWEFLKEKLELKEVTGYGVAGSCISTKSNYGTGNSPIVNRYTDIRKDADLICLFAGTNDYGHNTPMGTIDDTEDVSFYGALNIIINGLIENYPNARIVYMTPLHRYGFGGLNYDYEANSAGNTLDDYVTAIKAVCRRHSIPVIDTFAISGLDPSVEIIRTTYVTDGLHPNAVGHERLVENIYKQFENL